jgi:hypothetical protein
MSTDDSPPSPSEFAVYIQADRKREEHQGSCEYRLRPHGRTIRCLGPRMAVITRCDLEQRFELNLDDREYSAGPLPPHPATRDEWLAGARSSGQASTRREPTVLVETETVDTGERRNWFGHIGRRVIATRRVVPLKGAKRGPSESKSDGWYIDLDRALLCTSCDPWWRRSGPWPHTFGSVHRQGEEGDVPAFKDIGSPEMGHAVSVSVRWTSHDAIALPDGSKRPHTSVSEMQVTDLSTAAIDPSLFEIPAGFTLVERIRQAPVPPLLIRWKQRYDHYLRALRGSVVERSR